MKVSLRRLARPLRRLGVASLAMKLVLAFIVVLVMQLPAPAFTSPPRAAAPIVTGDLIVKFRDTSEAGAALAAVLGGTRTVESAAPLAARLSAEFGVPLKLLQVTSGREALLAIDRDALLRSLAECAAREPGVARAVPSVAAAPGLPTELASIRIELKPQASPDALAGKLASGDLLRPRLHKDPGGATLLSYDMTGLTLALLERIKSRADVEYAQANRLLRPVEGGKPR